MSLSLTRFENGDEFLCSEMKQVVNYKFLTLSQWISEYRRHGSHIVTHWKDITFEAAKTDQIRSDEMTYKIFWIN